ncbi:Signal peptidase complex subunit 2 [Nowakowskiella sp. JEL0407]|nr:Signal peptidase complex subunit 2 [Nowakowskiella sp. JEL0407]
MKLLLGYGSVLFAGAGALYSYVVPFPACKPLLAVCVAGYFILSTAMWYYGLYVQKDVIFQGKLKDKLGIQPDLILSASSTLPKHSDLYSLKLEFSRQYPKKSGKSKDSTTEISKSIGSWFDVSGRFAADVFHADLIKLAGNDLFKEK